MPEDYLREDEFPSDADLDAADDEPAEMRCPSCGDSVSEEAQKCPHCGDWITPADPSDSGPRRAVWILIVLLALISLLVYLI